MEISKLASRTPIFPMLIGASLLVGWLIPDFYEWTDSDQSRPSPLLWKVPLWSAIGSAAFCIALPWLPVATRPSHDAPRSRTRFSVRALLLLTAGVAVAMPLLAKFPLVVSGIVFSAVFASFIAFCIRSPPHRMAASALFACMYLPYAWVVGYEELDRILPALAVMIAGMPAILPSAWIGSMLGLHIQESQWLALLLSALELAIGIWMIRLGPKRTIAYLLIVLHLSALGSLVFHMLCLM